MDDEAGVLSRLAQVVARGSSGASLAARLCHGAVDILGATGGAITLSTGLPDRMTVGATDAHAARMEDLQEVLGEGPAAEAYATGQVVVADYREPHEARWPSFTRAVREDVMQQLAAPVALYALPMRPGPSTLGVLSVYVLGDVDLAERLSEAQFLADAVGAALQQDPDSYDAVGFTAWADRARVHQATGMVIAQLGVTPGDALALLRAHAFAHAVALDEIAAAVVERRLNFARSSDRNWSEDR